MRADEIIELAMNGEVLKKLERAGWVLAGVPKDQVESVADHSFGAALISLLLATHYEQEGHEIDLRRVLSMAILHDLAESKTSDIVVDLDASDSKVQLRAKVNAEQQAMAVIMESLGNVGKSFLALWDDLQDQSSLEARIVTSSDILDMLIHAVALERSGVSSINLSGFFESSKKRIEKLDIALVTEIFDLLLGYHEACIENDS
ncbi:MAG: HD domain-containing protein [Candidatus Thorarchaeota archaeon]